ncbi:MAG: hypothetical protein RRX92_08525 [Lachnospiraceae bacterium]
MTKKQLKFTLLLSLIVLSCTMLTACSMGRNKKNDTNDMVEKTTVEQKNENTNTTQSTLDSTDSVSSNMSNAAKTVTDVVDDVVDDAGNAVSDMVNPR